MSDEENMRFKVFISWSGPYTKHAAEILANWIEEVLQHVDIFCSERDIELGSNSINNISKNLNSTDYGIICLTKDNLKEPWINFEAGALSKHQDNARVWTLLFNLDKGAVKGPLSTFQHAIYEKKDMKKLIVSINKNSDKNKLKDTSLNKAFDKSWEQLKEDIDKIDAKLATEIQKPSEELMEEIMKKTLSLTEDTAKKINNALDSEFFNKLTEFDPDNSERIYRLFMKREYSNAIGDEIVHFLPCGKLKIKSEKPEPRLSTWKYWTVSKNRLILIHNDSGLIAISEYIKVDNFTNLTMSRYNYVVHNGRLCFGLGAFPLKLISHSRKNVS